MLDRSVALHHMKKGPHTLSIYFYFGSGIITISTLTNGRDSRSEDVSHWYLESTPLDPEFRETRSIGVRRNTSRDGVLLGVHVDQQAFATKLLCQSGLWAGN